MGFRHTNKVARKNYFSRETKEGKVVNGFSYISSVGIRKLPRIKKWTFGHKLKVTIRTETCKPFRSPFHTRWLCCQKRFGFGGFRFCDMTVKNTSCMRTIVFFIKFHITHYNNEKRYIKSIFVKVPIAKRAFKHVRAQVVSAASRTLRAASGELRATSNADPYFRELQWFPGRKLVTSSVVFSISDKETL